MLAFTKTQKHLFYKPLRSYFSSFFVYCQKNSTLET